MGMNLIREFKPALLFVSKFVGLYILLNLAYGLYITQYYPHPDPITKVVTSQTNKLLNFIGYETSFEQQSADPNVTIYNPQGKAVLSVFEGCNGLNVVVIFVAFIIAFGWHIKALWFMPLGIITIHLSNLVRITLLYLVSTKLPNYTYFAHKYLFTASIFLVVFALWYVWVKMVKVSSEHV